MVWKNWGDHPIVVAISVLAGLGGLVALGITLLPPRQAEPPISASVQPSSQSIPTSSPSQSQVVSNDGDNSPNINNSNGNVNLNIDNSTKVEAPSKKIPEFSGKIGSGSDSTAFREFIRSNDNKIVFLDVYIGGDSLNAKDRRDGVRVCDKSSIGNQCNENMFTLLYDCSEQDYGGAMPPCTGMNYRLNISDRSNNLFSYVQEAYYLKGFWSVRANPGMWQGIMSTTLTPVDTQDAK